MNERFDAGSVAEQYFGGYLVDTEKLRQVVYGEGIPLEVSHLIWTKFGIKARKAEGTDSFFLGIDLSDLYNSYVDIRHWLLKIMEDCRDMNKVPLVNIKGKPVDGDKFSFGFTTMPEGVKKISWRKSVGNITAIKSRKKLNYDQVTADLHEINKRCFDGLLEIQELLEFDSWNICYDAWMWSLHKDGTHKGWLTHKHGRRHWMMWVDVVVTNESLL